MNPTVRLAHFSDIHVTAPACSWRLRDWFNKRMSAWLNLRVLGRGKHFRYTDRILLALREELAQRNFHRVLFSGDATAMGFEEEVRRAAELLGLDTKEQLPGLSVPGNHDYCTHTALRSGHFERHFAPWQDGVRVADEIYPFAQRVGPVWLVGVNSSTANRWAWDARGHVGTAQLERLEKLLASLEPGPRILVTHYPIWLADGTLEHAFHGLRDLDALVSVAHRGGVVLWLHGHRHTPYHHAHSERVPFPVICAGSTTQSGCWSYSDYTLNGAHLYGVQRIFDERSECFRDGRTFELDLPQRGAITSRPPGRSPPT
ncbi:MAG TPA: metallophosphoesterase [Gemmataceae bacterium]|jgi:3',5'-cyclic AMP phosphodiesterase CpdA